jgi:hypothetical protein
MLTFLALQAFLCAPRMPAMCQKPTETHILVHGHGNEPHVMGSGVQAQEPAKFPA